MICRRLFLIAILGISVLWRASEVRGADWPEFMGPGRLGISEESEWNADWEENGEPQMLWKANVGVGAASFAEVGGRLYTTGNVDDEDIVWAMEGKTGRVLWQHKTPVKFAKRSFEGGTAATPTVDGDRVYSLTHEGHLACLQRINGQLIWTKHLVKDFGGKEPKWGYAGSPLIYGDLLITEPGGSGGNSVVALNKLTGELVWKSGSDEASYASPTLYRAGEQQGILVMNAYGLVGLDPKDGKQRFRMRWETSYDVNATTPIYLPETDQVFICSGYRTGAGLVQLSGDTGAEFVWKSKDLKLKFQNAVVTPDQKVAVGVIGRVIALDLKSGKVAWDRDVSGDEGHIILADGKALVLSEKGELILGDITGGGYKEASRIQAHGGRCWVLPVLANKRFYCRNNAGTVFCYDMAK